jgi:hypothetical protein
MQNTLDNGIQLQTMQYEETSMKRLSPGDLINSQSGLIPVKNCIAALRDLIGNLDYSTELSWW